MLMQQDFDLNSVHVYTESLKDVLKKTMLNQDIIFKKQVHELHRLYRIQKTLMQNLGWTEFDRYDSRNPSTEPSMFPYINPARYEPLAKEARVSSIPMVDLTHSTSQTLLEGCEHLLYRLQQRSADPQLLASQCNGHVDPDLKLSLSIGENNRRNGGAKRSWTRVKTSCWQNVIDLEGSDETTLSEDSGHAPSFSCAAPGLNFGGKHVSQVSVIIDPISATSIKKDPLHETVGSNSFLDEHERSTLDLDLNKCHGDILNNNLSTEKQPISSFATGHVDLNKVLFDDSSCYSNDPTMAHPSTASSSHFCGLVGRVEEGNFHSPSLKKDGSNEISVVLHPSDTGNSSFVDSKSNYEREDICRGSPKFDRLSGSEIGIIDLETVCGPKIGLNEDFDYHRNDSNDGSTLQLPKIQVHTQEATRMVIFEKQKIEDALFSCSSHSHNTVPDGDCNISFASCKPFYIADNESSNAEITQSEVQIENPLAVDQLSGNHKGSQVSETVSGDNQISTDSSEPKHEYLRKEESDEIDILIQEAAESLVHISLESSTCYRDYSTKDGEGGSCEMEIKEIQRPQCSSDSFELLTLELTESIPDDLSVSSKPPHVNFTETKDCGFKLRRGRRLKDFQKDILPGLSSLSRHEIREDINILEGVLRSREYKKMRAGMGDMGQSWCTPVRSRRSRLNYTGRRRFS